MLSLMTEKQAQNPSIERILPIPKLPPGIKEAVNRSELAVFIGAGVSKILGCKGWSETADELVKVCFQRGLINYKEKKALIQEDNQKKKISICQHILGKDTGTLFYDVISKSIQSEKARSDKFPIYGELHKLRAVYVTTNVDTCFDDLYFKDLIIYRPEDFNANIIDREHLYHLHGTINDHNSLIFTVRNYLEHYSKKTIKEFLERLFSEYSIMFVGYGLDEFEVMDFLFTKAHYTTKELKHFILLPMFRGEENILAFEESYYGDLGITVIPYAIDDQGYEQLYYVIENFEKEINLSSTFLHDSFEKIEKSIDHYDPENAKLVLQLIKNDRPLEDHFFQKLASAEWFLPLKKEGYFDPSKNPKPHPAERQGYFTIPSWNILNYLLKVSEQVAANKDARLEDALVEIFRSISGYREGGKLIDNYRTNWALTKILSNLPSAKVEHRDLETIGQFLDSEWDSSLIASAIGENLLPKFLRDNDREKILWLLEIATTVKWVKGPFEEEPEPLMSDYWFNSLIERNKTELSSLYPLDEAKAIVTKVEQIVAQNGFGLLVPPYSLVDSDTEAPLRDRFQNAVVIFARDLLDAAMTKDATNTKSYLKELLAKDSAVFKRLSLAVIARNWSVCSDLFFDFASREILIDPYLRYEVHALLERHYASFPTKNKDLFLQWIEQGPNWTRNEENQEVFQRNVAYWKQNWLSALTPSGYKSSIEAYQIYSKLTGMEPERPEPAMTVTFGSEPASPLGVQDLLQKTNEEIADYLKNFKEDKVGFAAPTIEGLGSSLYRAIQSDPGKFSNAMGPFLDVPLVYQRRIVGAFTDLWKEKREFMPTYVIDYCRQLVLLETFWKERGATESRYRMYVVSEIADLIVEGTKDDVHAYPPDTLPVIREIVFIMLDKVESDIRYPDDLLTAYLNSARGRAIRAFVNYALRVARLKKNGGELVRWDSEVKNEFTKRLDRSFEPSLEWSVSLGEFLPNLAYLDRAWVEENVDKIFTIEIKEHWAAVMEGYLALPQVYPELFRLLKSHGHYEKAIAASFRKEIRERLIDHICIGVLRGEEEISDNKSLIRQCLDLGTVDDVLEMISFFWMQRKYLVEDTDRRTPDSERLAIAHKQKILGFSLHIYDRLRINTSLSNDDKRILSRLGLLSCFLDRIDATTLPWLEFSAEFVNMSDSIFFVEYLNKLCDVSSREVGSVFLNLSTHLVTYTREEEIRSIVTKLYAREQKELADKICNTYFLKGLEFLRDLYEANKLAHQN